MNIENIVQGIIRPFFGLRCVLYAVLSLGFAVLQISEFSIATKWILPFTVFPLLLGSISVYGISTVSSWDGEERGITVPISITELLIIGLIIYFSWPNQIEIYIILIISSFLILTNVLYLLYAFGIITHQEEVVHIDLDSEPFVYIKGKDQDTKIINDLIEVE